MRTRELAHWHSGQHDSFAVASHRSVSASDESAYVKELAHVQACQYAALDGWTQLAEETNISWVATGGSLYGAFCFHAMIAWDDDMDIAVPQEECERLVRIWDQADAMPGVWPDNVWQPRRTRFGLTVWRSTTGQAATNGHRKFTTWDPLTAPDGRREHGIDVMCTGHLPEFTLPGGAPVPGTQALTSAVRERLGAAVEFGPTTILQLPWSLVLEFIKLRFGGRPCSKMPSMNAQAKAALKAYKINAQNQCKIKHHLGDTKPTSWCCAWLQDGSRTCDSRYMRELCAFTCANRTRRGAS